MKDGTSFCAVCEVEIPQLPPSPCNHIRCSGTPSQLACGLCGDVVALEDINYDSNKVENVGGLYLDNLAALLDASRPGLSACRVRDAEMKGTK